MRNWVLLLYTKITDLVETLSTKLNYLENTKENLSNKRTSLDNPNDTTYPSTSAVKTAIEEIPDPNDGNLSISTSDDLEGSGEFSANQASDTNINISLSEDIKEDISQGVEAYEWGDHSVEGYAKENWVQGELDKKVDKEAGKGLSSNDFRDSDKSKLDGIEAGAQVNIKPDWGAPSSSPSGILNKPDLGSAAFKETSDFATAVQGDKADTAVQFDDLDQIDLGFVLGNGNSASNLKITDLADGTNPLDAVNKQQLDGIESPFEIIDVTQTAYTDIAINVKDFGNTQAGMTYQEGAIDFGVSRDSIHEMGIGSFKLGLETNASGDYSSAFGNSTTASGNFSSAFGAGTTASGRYSSAFGVNTNASGGYSSAFGFFTTASASYSSAFGSNTTARGNSSSAFGSYTTASASYSSAFGSNTTASASYSSAFGFFTTASGGYSSAFGNYTEANEYASFAIGRFSEVGNVQNSWLDGSPIFKVGNGTSENNRKNAYTLYNDGRSEQEKDMEVTEIGQGFVVKSPDGTRWRITVDNSGNLDAEQL